MYNSACQTGTKGNQQRQTKLPTTTEGEGGSLLLLYFPNALAKNRLFFLIRLFHAANFFVGKFENGISLTKLAT